MSDIVERAAQALKAEADRLFEQKTRADLRDFWAGREDAGWECLVRAVLTAIREPTIPMLMSGRKQTFADMAGAHLGPSAENTFKAMIDAALNGPDSAARTNPVFKTVFKTASEAGEKPL